MDKLSRGNFGGVRQVRGLVQANLPEALVGLG